MGVIIGVDPHKGSHTAVAIGDDEARLVQLTGKRREQGYGGTGYRYARLVLPGRSNPSVA